MKFFNIWHISGFRRVCPGDQKIAYNETPSMCDSLTDRRTDRPTKQGTEAPIAELKNHFIHYWKDQALAFCHSNAKLPKEHMVRDKSWLCAYTFLVMSFETIYFIFYSTNY